MSVFATANRMDTWKVASVSALIETVKPLAMQHRQFTVAWLDDGGAIVTSPSRMERRAPNAQAAVR